MASSGTRNFFFKVHKNQEESLVKVKPEEIILEWDNKDRSLNQKYLEQSHNKLRRDGYKVRTESHNGKSDYLVLEIPELKNHPERVRCSYKKIFIEKYGGGKETNVDTSFTNPNHHRPALNVLHWKKKLAEEGSEEYSIEKYKDYTEHKIIHNAKHFDNTIDPDLLKLALQNQRRVKQRQINQNDFTAEPDLLIDILKKFDKLEDLKEEERSWRIKNPFFKDSNTGTSFSVWKDTPTWTCFRSGQVSGGAVSLIALLSNIRDNPEHIDSKPLGPEEVKSVHIIAKQKGIDLPYRETDWTKIANDLKGFAETLYKDNPYFTANEKCLMWWDPINETYIKIDSDTKLFYQLEKLYGYDDSTLKTGLINQLWERLIRSGYGEDKQPEQLSENEIATLSGIYDITTGKKTKELTFKTWTPTIIPHKVGSPGKMNFRSIDKLLKEWADSSEKQDMLYDFLAYSLWNNYNIQKIFVLEGEGKNGKDTFLRLVRRLIGHNNYIAEDLQNFERDVKGEIFYRTKGKLLIELAETQMDKIKSSANIKKLTGGSPISGRLPYQITKQTWINTAKLLMTTNRLPGTSDFSDGFFRRFCIVQFNNQFESNENFQGDLIDTIPDSEFSHLLAELICEISPRLYKTKKIRHEKSIKETRAEYQAISSSFHWFYERELEFNDYTSGLVIPWEEVMTKYQKAVQEHSKETGLRIPLQKQSDIRKMISEITGVSRSSIVRDRKVKNDFGDGYLDKLCLTKHKWKTDKNEGRVSRWNKLTGY